MKLLLDTCVLYPTVMREMLIGAAKAGLFEPLWSQRILGEWQHTAAKRGPVDGAQAEAEIALLSAAWPGAKVHLPETAMARFWLPDSGDIHVLAAAALGGADGIVTLNNKDFPKQILAEEGLDRINPDALLAGFVADAPDAMSTLASSVLSRANEMAGGGWTARSLMKKARLPRLGKGLERLGV